MQILLFYHHIQFSKLISKNYKVAISGDGGDELSGGYLRTRQILQSKNLNNTLLSLIYKIYLHTLMD